MCVRVRALVVSTQLIINIGLHCGEVFVGNLGAPKRLKYGVLGDSVNLSARLSRLNTRYKTSILVSEDVAKLPEVSTCLLYTSPSPRDRG